MSIVSCIEIPRPMSFLNASGPDSPSFRISPLASGLLTGKYRRGKPIPKGTRLSDGSDSLSDENLSIVEELVHFAESKKHTLLELAFAWLLAHPAVASVIAGATKPEQVRANAATANWRLTPEERAAVDALAMYS
jgi:aryl-alcohol dehydrogenase-like predicted oxidoreductase